MSAQELDLAKLEPWLRGKVPPFEGARYPPINSQAGQSNPHVQADCRRTTLRPATQATGRAARISPCRR